MSRFYPTMSLTPTAVETEAAILVDAFDPLVYLTEDSLYADSDFETNSSKHCSDLDKRFNEWQTSILYDQVKQLEGETSMPQFAGEGIFWQRDGTLSDRTKVELRDSGGKTVARNSRREKSARKRQETVSYPPNSSRKPASLSDCRRRREKANEREKQRIIVLKNAMNVLKNAIPVARERTKITKLEVLKLATDYISSLRSQLSGETVAVNPRRALLPYFEEQRNLFVYNNGSL